MWDNAHLLRYAQAASDERPSAKWPGELKALLARAAADGSPRSEELRDRYVARLGELMDGALAETKAFPASEYDVEGTRLINRLCEYGSQTFLFLKEGCVSATNNVCERNLRKYKRKQKQAIALRSEGGVDAVCAFLTVTETAKMKGRSPFREVARIMGAE